MSRSFLFLRIGGISVPAIVSCALNIYCIFILRSMEPPGHFPTAECNTENTYYEQLVTQSNISLWRIAFHSINFALSLFLLIMGNVPCLLRIEQEAIILMCATSSRVIYCIIALVYEIVHNPPIYTLLKPHFLLPCSKAPFWVNYNLDQIIARYGYIIFDYFVCMFTHWMAALYKKKVDRMMMDHVDPIRYGLRRTISNPNMTGMLHFPRLPKYKEALHMRIASKDEIPKVVNEEIEMHNLSESVSTSPTASGSLEEDETIQNINVMLHLPRLPTYEEAICTPVANSGESFDSANEEIEMQCLSENVSASADESDT